MYQSAPRRRVLSSPGHARLELSSPSPGGATTTPPPHESEEMRPPTARRLALTAALALLAIAGSASTPDDEAPQRAPGAWSWPASGRITAQYRQPAHAYAPGHRGVDILADGATVVAPADGVVLFSGTVVDRPLLTIQHTDELVSTLEPVASELVAGTPVRRAEPVGTLSSGGHADPGELHFGVRRSGEYINPLTLLGGVPRAVLLPCC